MKIETDIQCTLLAAANGLRSIVANVHRMAKWQENTQMHLHTVMTFQLKLFIDWVGTVCVRVTILSHGFRSLSFLLHIC